MTCTVRKRNVSYGDQFPEVFGPQRPKRARHSKSGERGLSPVVGVILMIGVFAVAIAVWLSVMVPAWHRSSESAWMDSVRDSLVLVKRGAEGMVRDYLANPAVAYSLVIDFRLSSEPIPYFGYVTNGTLSVDNGRLVFYAPNREYPQQTWVYENGALIMVQGAASIMKSPPAMVTVLQREENIEVYITFVEVSGEGSASGTGTASVKFGPDNFWYAVEGEPMENIAVEMFTNVAAWRSYFEDEAAAINGRFEDAPAGVEWDNSNSWVRLVIGGGVRYWERHVKIYAQIGGVA